MNMNAYEDGIGGGVEPGMPNEEDSGARVRHRSLVCPHCSQLIYVGIETKIFSVSPGHAGVCDPEAEWEKSLHPAMVKYLDVAKKHGVLDLFATCVRNTSTQVPKHMEKHFVTVMRTARPKVIPRFALDLLMGMFPAERIEYYSAQGVGIVTASGKIRMFVPSALAVGDSVAKPSGGRLHMRLDADENALREWVRLKTGYVPVDCPLFIAALRKVSIGDFDKPAL